MSQSDFSVKANSQTKKEADRWAKEAAHEQRHTTPLLISQKRIKWHTSRVIDKRGVRFKVLHDESNTKCSAVEIHR